MMASRTRTTARVALHVLAGAIYAVLLTFTARRVLFALAILRRPSGRHSVGYTAVADSLPNVLILVACRDEAEAIDRLCRDIAALDYPVEKRRLVLVNDGSRDATAQVMEQACQGRSGWSVVSLDSSVGKAAAMNVALRGEPFGEIVYVLDADHRPDPSALKRVVGYFDDPLVAGVNGRMVACNATASAVAYYATVEGLIHQLVTMRAKDRLGLAPALLGSNCAYRRRALQECGLFRPGALSEDYDLTLAFYRQGYRVRFAEDVVSYHEVPEHARGYLKQHVRWGRGIYAVARNHAWGVATQRGLSAAVRLELLILLAGYLDRAALIGSMVLTGLSALNPRLINFPAAVLAIVLLTPAAQIATLFAEQRADRGMWLRLPLVPLMFGLDVLAAINGLFSAFLGRPLQWTKTERMSRQ